MSKFRTYAIRCGVITGLVRCGIQNLARGDPKFNVLGGRCPLVSFFSHKVVILTESPTLYPCSDTNDYGHDTAVTPKSLRFYSSVYFTPQSLLRIFHSVCFLELEFSTRTRK